MVYRGRIRNGVVVLDDGQKMAEGVCVRVEAVETEQTGETHEDTRSLYEQLEPLIGSIENLPPDLASNHDHYLHGIPKK